MTVLRAGDLTPDDLRRLLSELTFPGGESIRCWLDGPDGWTLDYWPGLQGQVRWNGAGRDPSNQSVYHLLPRIVSGRIFSPSGELKWRVLPALGERPCRTVFLGDWPLAVLELLPLRSQLNGLAREAAEYPLWGQMTPHTPSEWVDLRIPHRLRYPVQAETPKQGRIIAIVHVEIWKDRRGEPQFIRLCDLTARLED